MAIGVTPQSQSWFADQSSLKIELDKMIFEEGQRSCLPHRLRRVALHANADGRPERIAIVTLNQRPGFTVGHVARVRPAHRCWRSSG